MDQVKACEKIDVVHVALRIGRQLSTLTYLKPKDAKNLIGKRVRVSLGKRTVDGVITEEGSILEDQISLKPVLFVSDDDPVLTSEQIALSRFVSDYYESPFYDVLKLCLPKHNKRVEAKQYHANDSFLASLKQNFNRKSKNRQITKSFLVNNGFTDVQIDALLRCGELSLVSPKSGAHKDFKMNSELKSHSLTTEQNSAINDILHTEHNAFLLQGVTGSGKTEVYLEVAKEILSQGHSVLFIVPEIALTPQLQKRMEFALGKKAVVIHSSISSTVRDNAFEEIRQGKSQVIIGARSALFCPAKNLGLIVVDEEHDSGFKQEESPRYHARDVALWRAKNENAKVILGSATPSLESLQNARAGRLHHLKLLSRPLNNVLPHVEVIDLKERRAHDISRLKDRPHSHGSSLCILSSPLRNAIFETLKKNEQVILFLNRRGWASYLICEDCGHILKCKDCSISLTFHKKNNVLQCHQCSYRMPFSTRCPECTEGILKPLGLGTERVEKELQMSFPNATVARFDRESMRRPSDLAKTLSKLHSGEIQILVGTQMIAKGHDFPNVTLVGVILADSGLGLPDFRASERCFQLLTQVSGRAGRRETAGKVIIQTFNPEHPAIAYTKNHDVDGFCEIELRERKQFFYPPFSRAALVRFESQVEEEAEKFATLGVKRLHEAAQKLGNEHIQILGPAPCPNLKVRQYYRWQIFIKSKTVALRKELVRAIRSDASLKKWNARSKSRISIDIDPILLL